MGGEGLSGSSEMVFHARDDERLCCQVVEGTPIEEGLTDLAALLVVCLSLQA